jgi:hypothetical protein
MQESVLNYVAQQGRRELHVTLTGFSVLYLTLQQIRETHFEVDDTAYSSLLNTNVVSTFTLK